MRHRSACSALRCAHVHSVGRLASPVAHCVWRVVSRPILPASPTRRRARRVCNTAARAGTRERKEGGYRVPGATCGDVEGSDDGQRSAAYAGRYVCMLVCRANVGTQAAAGESPATARCSDRGEIHVLDPWAGVACRPCAREVPLARKARVARLLLAAGEARCPTHTHHTPRHTPTHATNPRARRKPAGR